MQNLFNLPKAPHKQYFPRPCMQNKSMVWCYPCDYYGYQFTTWSQGQIMLPASHSIENLEIKWHQRWYVLEKKLCEKPWRMLKIEIQQTATAVIVTIRHCNCHHHPCLCCCSQQQNLHLQNHHRCCHHHHCRHIIIILKKVLKHYYQIPNQHRTTSNMEFKVDNFKAIIPGKSDWFVTWNDLTVCYDEVLSGVLPCDLPTICHA